MLNRAHWLHRQAERAARKGNWEEAVAHHREAATILQQLLASVVHQKARESIRLQAEFHTKEQLLIHDFRARCDAIAENIERYKSRRTAMEAGDENAVAASGPAAPSDLGFRHLRGGGGAGAGDNLHTNIYRAFEETESLLDRLKEKDVGGFPQSCPSNPVAMTRQNVVNSATKKPKDDKVIIEELEVANAHLRRMVILEIRVVARKNFSSSPGFSFSSLFIELDQCQKENIALREKIRRLEDQLEQSELRHQQRRTQSFAAVHDGDEEDLPPLAPLEIPTFQFEK